MKVLFSHANGYPPGSYRALIAALEESNISAVIRHEHRPLVTHEPAPRFLSWNAFAFDLIARVEKNSSEPIWLIGHSMGASSAILAAAKKPNLFAGVIAIDPVLVPTKIWFWSQLMIRIKPNVPFIVKRALGRPHRFESKEEAFRFYRGKRVFADISDAVLADYVSAGHQNHPDGGICLRFSGAWEACIYRSTPYMANALRALRCPCLIIAGDHSEVLTSDRLKWAIRKNSGIRSTTLPGTHLVPLEIPEDCAQKALEFIATI